MANGIRQGASTRPTIGQRVRLTRGHPALGECGTVIAWETPGLFPGEGPKPRVRLDSGHECFILRLTQWRPAGDPSAL